MTKPLDHAALDDLLARGDVAGAVGLVGAAADGGDADAVFQQAIWHLIGTPLPRDLPRARRLLGRAAGRGHADAAAAEIALTANGSGGSADWSSARRLLDQGGDHPSLLRQRELLAPLVLAPDGAPRVVPPSRALVDDGSIRLFPAFAAPAECAHLAAETRELLAPAVVVDSATGATIRHPVRDADEAVFGPTREDLVVRAINLRIAAASGTDVAQGEALTVLRYAPGQRFKLHSDVIGRTRNERCATMLVYLNDAFEGGETSFPDHGLVVKPKAGDALLFRNTLADGRPDPRKRHAGEPVTRGVKWLATRWIRTRPFDPWTGPEG